MQTFQYQLTQIHLENGRYNGERDFLSDASSDSHGCQWVTNPWQFAQLIPSQSPLNRLRVPSEHESDYNGEQWREITSPVDCVGRVTCDQSGWSVTVNDWRRPIGVRWPGSLLLGVTRVAELGAELRKLGTFWVQRLAQSDTHTYKYGCLYRIPVLTIRAEYRTKVKVKCAILLL